MNKPIYKNYKTGKYYTFDVNEQTNESKIKTVFIKDATYDSLEVKVDKNGKVYKIAECEAKTLKNGYDVYTVR